MIGNPPYVESRNSIFSDELKDNLQKNIRLRYKEEDRRSFPRGADLLIFFFELSFRLLNKNGINTFITENSWLSTDYGKDFQTYLLKYIDIQGIVDSDYKYFETADINTVISFFKLNNDNKVLSVNFFHTHENLEKYPCNTSNPKLNNNCIELKTFNNTDSILKKYKWGFIYSTEKKLIDLVEKMDNLQDCNIKKKISIGQGLNLTKDKILKSKTKNCVPFFTSETGPILTWTETETYVDKKNISSSRKIPLLILPRGLGTHFCCMNEISGYSTSFVEIYEEEETLYTVKAGDTLYKIAAANNTTVDEIKALNNLTSNNLSIGQLLKLPSPLTPETTYTVEKGDSLYAIANKYNTTVDALKKANNLTSNILSIGQVLKIPTVLETETGITYTVKSGDSLYSIAREYNTTVDAIKSLNNLSSNLLSIGQVLKIPTGASLETTYTVQKGDSLYSIAKKFNTTVATLKELNNLTSNLLSIGQILIVR